MMVIKELFVLLSSIL